MKSDAVPHGSFREGFNVGYQLIRGVSAAVPGAPGGPGPHAGTGSFLLGVTAGIRAAGGEVLGRDKLPLK
jgi:hypothetical protein